MPCKTAPSQRSEVACSQQLYRPRVQRVEILVLRWGLDCGGKVGRWGGVGEGVKLGWGNGGGGGPMRLERSEFVGNDCALYKTDQSTGERVALV